MQFLCAQMAAAFDRELLLHSAKVNVPSGPSWEASYKILRQFASAPSTSFQWSPENIPQHLECFEDLKSFSSILQTFVADQFSVADEAGLVSRFVSVFPYMTIYSADDKYVVRSAKIFTDVKDINVERYNKVEMLFEDAKYYGKVLFLFSLKVEDEVEELAFIQYYDSPSANLKRANGSMSKKDQEAQSIFEEKYCRVLEACKVFDRKGKSSKWLAVVSAASILRLVPFAPRFTKDGYAVEEGSYFLYDIFQVPLDVQQLATSARKQLDAR